MVKYIPIMFECDNPKIAQNSYLPDVFIHGGMSLSRFFSSNGITSESSGHSFACAIHGNGIIGLKLDNSAFRLHPLNPTASSKNE